jgi:hypothetical protein
MPVALIGGNKLSPFYSSIFFVPFSGQTTFTPLAEVNALPEGLVWELPFTRCSPRRRHGLADTTDSWMPLTRGRRRTQVDWDCHIRMFTNPDEPVETQLDLASNTDGFQMYAMLGLLANYPSIDLVQYYWWVPSVFLEEAPHTMSLEEDPVQMIKNDIMVRSNSPAFFLPTDGPAAESGTPIYEFLTWCQGMSPAWAF